MHTAPGTTHHYFVDEAGDLTLFDRKKRLRVGDAGVSHCFIVGAALIHDPEGVGRQLEELRTRLLGDPYFAGVPSMTPAAQKTALLFHAKDDVPEVRREVFSLLRNADVEVYAAFRRKRAVADEVRAHYERTGHKLGSDFVYDDLVTSVFQNRLHLADQNHIVFARRGKADRNIALTKAIELAKWKFEARWKKGINRPTTIASNTRRKYRGFRWPTTICGRCSGS